MKRKNSVMAYTDPSAPRLLRRHAGEMRHGRRVRPDPLLPVNATRWLVFRDQLSRAVACEQLQPLVDLRATLEQERARRRIEGWTVENISPAGAFFFCSRGSERCCVSIENYAPGTSPIR